MTSSVVPAKPSFWSRVWATIRAPFTGGWKVKLSSIFIFIVAFFTVFHHYRAPAIELAQVILPSQLSSAGVSARELTLRLRDHIDSLRDAAHATVSQSQWAIASEIKYPEIEIPGVKTSLPAFLDFLDEMTGRDVRKVKWEISGRPTAAGTTTQVEWLVSANVTGGRLHQSTFALNDPNAALTKIALAILADAEPHLAARVLRFAGNCEAARSLASRQMRLAATPQQRVAANNMMGFVSECGFQDSGPNMNDAELSYRQAIDANTRDPLPHLNLGRLLAEVTDSLAESEREFRAAADLDPDLPATYEAWGYGLLLFGKTDEAIEKLNRAIQLDPRGARAFANRGYAYLSRATKADTVRAMADFAASLFRQPDVAVMKVYGGLLVEKHAWRAAAEVYSRAARLGPATDTDTQYWLAYSLDSAGNWPAAAAAYRRTAAMSTEGDLYCTAVKKRLLDSLKQCGAPPPPGGRAAGGGRLP